MLDVVQTAVVVMAMLMIVMMFVIVMMVGTFVFVAVVGIIVTMVVLMFMLIAMFMVVMVMMLATFLFAIDHYRHMCPCDSTLYGFLSLILYTWDSKLIQFLYKFFWFWDEFEKCRTQHVSSCSHSTIDI